MKSKKGPDLAEVISSANLTYGLTLGLILLISIISLVVGEIIKISSKRIVSKNTNRQNSIASMLIIIGISGILFSCAG